MKKLNKTETNKEILYYSLILKMSDERTIRMLTFSTHERLIFHVNLLKSPVPFLNIIGAVGSIDIEHLKLSHITKFAVIDGKPLADYNKALSEISRKWDAPFSL